ncbi:hypothetical protein AYO47_00070 [Planctomyces sp. SCGC AG-212-M04]|nr:hypothetical protein AYO47_00070 [Planctomyces sp. SCGC AG-212-M04]
MAKTTEEPNGRRKLVPFLVLVAVLTVVVAGVAGVNARRQFETGRWINAVKSQGLQVRVPKGFPVEVEVSSEEDVRRLLQIEDPYPSNLSICCGGSVTTVHMARLETRFQGANVFWPK